MPRPDEMTRPDERPVGGLTFVLGGGGALGGFQAGGLLALLEAGLVPDRLVGCSAGALNSAFIAADPTPARARELTEFWTDPKTRGVLSPAGWQRARSFASVLTSRGESLLDPGPLRRLVAARLPAHDVAELAVPLTVTTTCLDCAAAVHHTAGPLAEVLLASCALPGLLPPSRLPDGHLHVDGGIVCGVPVGAALSAAGPLDLVLVLDCGLSPVTCTTTACSLGGTRDYVPPAEEEMRVGVVDVTLRAFTVARTAANRAAVAEPMLDPRVRVLPHVGDTFGAGLLQRVPRSPRDFSLSGDLVAAGHASVQSWLAGDGLAGGGLARGGLVPAASAQVMRSQRSEV